MPPIPEMEDNYDGILEVNEEKATPTISISGGYFKALEKMQQS